MTVRKTRDLVVYCDRPSDTAKTLSKRLNARRLFGTSSRRLRSLAGCLVVNYGTGHSPTFDLGTKSIVLNKPENVNAAISKRSSFAAFQKSNVSHLEFTTEHSTATAWVQEGHGVLCRRDGLSGGAGITFVPKGSQDPLPKSDFYTKYFAKTHEYRAHVFSGRLIDLTQKRLQNGKAKDEASAAEERIVRSLDNGWVHAHGFECSQVERQAIEAVAISAISALGLDFGAVDILVKRNDKKPSQVPVVVVCEVNTAPGLANEVTLKAYEEAIKRVYSDTRADRDVPVRSRRKRVRKLVKVWITTRKGNRVQRDRYRMVYE